METSLAGHNTPHNAPPGPTGRGIFGTARQFQKAPLDYLTRIHQEFGDSLRYRFFLNWYGYSFVHPDANKHILQDNNANYTKQPHPSMQILKPLAGDGLLTSDGDFWRKQRRLAQPAFHRSQIAGFAQTFVDSTVARFDRWGSRASSGKGFAFDEELMALTLEIAGKTLFSIDLTGKAEQVGHAFDRANRIITDLSSQPFALFTLRIPFWPSTRKLFANTRQMEEVVYGIIDERRRSGEQKADLLGMLMEARDEETGEGMSVRQLRDEVLTLMVAGHETTSVLLSWLFYFLDRHPEVRERLEAEVDSVLSGRTPIFEDLPHLRYTRQVIDETLRIRPAAYIMTRWAQQADTVCGYNIPAQSGLVLCPYITHHLPEFWPEPQRFNPERFAAGKEAERPRYAYLPFGGGPRQCIGNSFALTEATLITAAIVQRFRVRVDPSHPAAMDPQITLRMKGGLPARLEERR